MVHVDLSELLDTVFQCLHSIVAAVGIAQILEYGKPVVVTRDRKMLVPALTPGEARQINDSQVVLWLLQLFPHHGPIQLL